MRCPAPTRIDDITDALSLRRLLVSGAVGRPLPPTVAVDAFRRARWQPVRVHEPAEMEFTLDLLTGR